MLRIPLIRAILGVLARFGTVAAILGVLARFGTVAKATLKIKGLRVRFWGVENRRSGVHEARYRPVQKVGVLVFAEVW
jgi:hypothetical protein